MANHGDDLDRWVQHGLLSPEQRSAILAFERERVQVDAGDGPGRLASAISTVGAAVAIAATGGIVLLFVDDWSAVQGMLAAAVAALVMIVAAWQLVRNGWGAPAGLCALCGLALIPVALVQGADVAGWWPEDTFGPDWEDVERERQRITGIVLLISIVPGMLTTRLGLRQAWMALPAALWFGVGLLFTNPFESVGWTVAQVVFAVNVAAVAIFFWHREGSERSSAWWLQLGGLLLAGQGIIFSAFEDRPIYALLGVLVAAGLFIVGVTRNRTAWMVTGALAGVFPAGSLIFEYVEDEAGLLVVALAGLAVAFLPLILLRRRAVPDS